MGDFRPTLITFGEKSLECFARRNKPELCAKCKLRYKCYSQREKSIELDVTETEIDIHNFILLPDDESIKAVAKWLWDEKFEVKRKYPGGGLYIIE